MAKVSELATTQLQQQQLPKEVVIEEAEKHLEFIKKMQKANQIAHLYENEDGKVEWVGEQSWPLFAGYPFIEVEEDEEGKNIRLTQKAKFPVKLIGESKENHCFVFTRTDSPKKESQSA